MDNRCQSNILLCGSPRVGKSTLINAICQQKLAKANGSLNSVTNEVTPYSYEYTNGRISHQTIIWDTPGIESWDRNDVHSYIRSLVERTHPLCMIYCASPGSFARLDHLAWLIQECHRQGTFCALVCTNMWAGRDRKLVVEEFSRVLTSVHPTIKPSEEDQVIYYEKLALVTMVNSEEFHDEDFGVTKAPSGVEELIFGIAKSLDRELMFEWFRSVAQNKSFWTKMASKLSVFLKMPMETFTSFRAYATNFLDSFLPSYPNTPLPTTDAIEKKGLFDDALIVCIPEHIYPKKLTFTLESQEMIVVSRLCHILQKFGAQSYKTQSLSPENPECYAITAEFENDQQADAIYELWQLAMATKIDCHIAHEQTSNSQIETLF